MAKIDVTDRDKIMLSNIPKLMKMGKFDLTGDEIVAASQVFTYIGTLINKINESIENEKKPKPIEAEQKISSPEKPKTKSRGRKKKIEENK